MLAVHLLPERDCATCTVHQMRNWGCEEDAESLIELDGEELNRCPRREFKEFPAYYGHLMWLYTQWQKGFLPEEGGLNSQPFRLVESIRIIDTAIGAVQAHEEEMERRKTARAKAASLRR